MLVRTAPPSNVYYSNVVCTRGRVLALMLALGFSAPALAAQDRIAPLKVHVGEVAPDFALPDASGHLVRLSSFRGQDVLLDFYRGYW